MMDTYGVITFGDWLISVPGAVVYLVITIGLIVLTRPKVLWTEVSVLIAFNILWLALGLSFIVAG
jgi:hypothetical protein